MSWIDNSNRMNIGEVYHAFYDYPLNDSGLIYQSLNNIESFAYLQTYLNDLDYEEYFNHGGQRIREIFLSSINNKEFLETSVRKIFLSHAYQLRTWIDTLNLEYNPIENYNMVETEKRDNSKEDSGNDSLKINHDTTTTMQRGAQSGTSTDNMGSQSGNTTATQKIAPYNASFTDNQQNTGNYTNNAYTNSTQSSSASYTDSDAITGNDTHTTTYGKKEDFNENRTLSRSGNIGITTSQQMLTAEREVAKFDVIRKIIGVINHDLCSGVYYTL